MTDTQLISTARSSCTLSTSDNPYNPFKDFTQWFLFDVEKGHNSCSYLARIANVSDQLSDEEYIEEIERAIDEIVSYDFQNLYIKVYATEEENKKETTDN